MLAASSDTTDNLVPRDTAFDAWAAQTWLDTYRRFDDQRLAGAAVVVRAATRVTFTGAGAGLDAARFGALALREAGFEARAAHAADIAAGALSFGPGEVVIGIDTGREDTPAALARARALGLRAVGLTDQDLTLIHSDILMHYSEAPNPPLHAGRSPLAACAALSLLAARAEPAAPLAFETTRFHTYLERLASAGDTADLMLDRLHAGAGRLLLAAGEPDVWVVEGVARRVNARDLGVPPVLPVHLADLTSPGWEFRADDLLITLEPGVEESGMTAFEPRNRPAFHWRIGGPQRGAQLHARLPAQSPALASLAAHIVLELLLNRLAAR